MTKTANTQLAQPDPRETLFQWDQRTCVPVIPLVTASIIANKLSLCSFQSAGRRDLSGDPQQSTNTSNWKVLVFM